MTIDVPVLRVPGWERYPWLRAGFSTRRGGVSQAYGPDELNLGWTREDAPAAVAENRRRFALALGGAPEMPLVTLRQVHGTRLRRVAGAAASLQAADGRALLEGDGLLTGQPGLLLGAQAADCVPVLLADTRLRVVAAVHAGWRGTRAGIAAAAVAALAAEFGSHAEDLVAAIGPAIGPCCYTVGPEVQAEFAAAFPYAAELFAVRQGALHLDLWAANRRQLLAAGLPQDAVTVLGACTACERSAGARTFFSHRAERGVTGRAMGAIGLRLA